MNRSIKLQRIDPSDRAYRWYNMSLYEKGEDLFQRPQVVITRGRIGQAGETITRDFENFAEASEYFEKKIKEKLSGGYVEVEEIKLLIDEECNMCKLVKNAKNDFSYIYEFKNSILILNWDQTYIGRSILVFKKHLPDFFRLAPSELLSILSEIKNSEIAIRKAFYTSMMNYLFMGNKVGHVHLHLVPRYKEDPNYGNSPFLQTSRTEKPQLPESEYKKIAEAIRKNII